MGGNKAMAVTNLLLILASWLAPPVMATKDPAYITDGVFWQMLPALLLSLGWLAGARSGRAGVLTMLAAVINLSIVALCYHFKVAAVIYHGWWLAALPLIYLAGRPEAQEEDAPASRANRKIKVISRVLLLINLALPLFYLAGYGKLPEGYNLNFEELGIMLLGILYPTLMAAGLLSAAGRRTALVTLAGAACLIFPAGAVYVFKNAPAASDPQAFNNIIFYLAAFQFLAINLVWPLLTIVTLPFLVIDRRKS